MIFLRAFSLICALSFCQSQLLSPREWNRPFRYSNHYQSFYIGQQNKSYEQQLDAPEEYKFRRASRYESSSPINSESPVAIFRTVGRGKAVVQKQGETVHVPNELARKKGNKGGISMRVTEKKAAEMKSNRSRGVCRECPSDQTVVASKGNTFALLPEPCPPVPKMWNHHSGPRPGSKIQEGVHAIRGTLGPKKKICEYSYQVIVNRCEPLKASEEDTTIECSAHNAWGSICTISCGKEKELLGPSETECKEDLTWSNSLPICKNKTDCSTPKIKTKSKITCQTANTSFIEGDLPNGSTCRFKQNGKVISITCKDGRWLKSRKSVALLAKENKQSGKERLRKTDACNPNPCKNGGTCLKPESSIGSPICKCRPQTQGVHCELRECYYNICENEGLCIYQNEESTCYCSPDYGGNRCQNYISPDSLSF